MAGFTRLRHVVDERQQDRSLIVKGDATPELVGVIERQATNVIERTVGRQRCRSASTVAALKQTLIENTNVQQAVCPLVSSDDTRRLSQ